jgi:hypothetical protein
VLSMQELIFKSDFDKCNIVFKTFRGAKIDNSNENDNSLS